MKPFNATHALGIQQARAIIGNPAAYAEVPDAERRRVFDLAWSVLKSQTGNPALQHRFNHIDLGPRGAA